MPSELHALARRLERIAEQHRWSQDFTFFGLQTALREVIACFPVYRTYIRPTQTAVGEEDRSTSPRPPAWPRRNPAMSASLFDFIATVLLLDDPWISARPSRPHAGTLSCASSSSRVR